MSALPPEQVEEFWRHVAALEAEHGVALTDEGKMSIIHAIAQHGFSPDVTQAAFGEILAEAAEAEGDEDADTVEDDYEPSWEDEDSSPEAAEQFEADLHADLGRLQTKLGRKLTERELAGMEQHMGEAMRKVGAMGADAETALENYYAAEGRTAPDLGKREDRIDYMAERMREGGTTEADAPTAFDMDTHEGRVAFMEHRLNGGEVEYVEEN